MCTDNRRMAEEMKTSILSIDSLGEKYEVLDKPSRYGKDVNEALRIWLGR